MTEELDCTACALEHDNKCMFNLPAYPWIGETCRAFCFAPLPAGEYVINLPSTS